ncbi:head-tail adaptor protein [Kordiimonas sp. SCSIO 12610]|uniref:phage head completion protein n=1 Tax=Kordiimonas sp. SCSIO 12610 TaxID=2829597 RepID=UPI00210B7258|nr:head-tail adaptor protein [Kordiimonas sp. SCSIO 12610]UTW56185.1 head-tail adaptor protein [Kordiimonas sp. SCSIO 12610]
MRERAFGKRRERITLLSATRTVGDGGRAEIEYGEIATIWASAESVERAINDFADKAEMAAVITFTGHYAERYFKARRLMWRGRTFRITAITEPDLMRRDLEFSAEEIFR